MSLIQLNQLRKAKAQATIKNRIKEKEEEFANTPVGQLPGTPNLADAMTPPPVPTGADYSAPDRPPTNPNDRNRPGGGKRPPPRIPSPEDLRATGTHTSATYTDRYGEKKFLNESVNLALQKLMAQQGNTVDEEELARKNNERELGRALADQRAITNLGGFGLSGAAATMDADLRSSAADKLTDKLLGIRKDARAEQLENLRTAASIYDAESQRQAAWSAAGAGAHTDFDSDEANRGWQGGQNDKDRDLTQQELDITEDAYNKLLEILDEDGSVSDSTDSTDGPDSSWNDNETPDTDISGTGTNRAATETEDTEPDFMKYIDPRSVQVSTDIPANSVYLGTDNHGNKYWRTPFGTTIKVPA